MFTTAPLAPGPHAARRAAVAEASALLGCRTSTRFGNRRRPAGRAVTWGEPDGGSRKPHVERHDQTVIRATVVATPYSSAARADQGASIAGWRRPSIDMLASARGNRRLVTRGSEFAFAGNELVRAAADGCIGLERTD